MKVEFAALLLNTQYIGQYTTAHVHIRQHTSAYVEFAALLLNA